MPANNVSTIAINRDVSAIGTVNLSVQETGVRVRAIPLTATLVNLPAKPFPNDGDAYQVIDADGSCTPTNLLIVSAPGATTIRGAGVFVMSTPFNSAWFTFDANADEWIVELANGSGGGGVNVPWVDVASGTAQVWTPADEFLSFDSTGPAQSTLALPVAASIPKGAVFYARLTGATTVTPVIINAGAGTTIELVGGPSVGGTFGASTYLPYEAMCVGFKYDNATAQWKVFTFDRGNTIAAQQTPTWVFTGGADTNSGLDAGHALATPGELIRRLGGTVGDRVALQPLGGGADDWPRLMGSATGQGIAQACAATGTTVVLGGGAWSCKTALPTPSNVTIQGSPDVVITATLPNGGILDTVFQMVSTTAGTTIALSANNVPGTPTLSAATAPIGGWLVGQFFQLEVGAAHLHGNTYQIKNVAGLGPFTLTVDRPVLYTALMATANLNLVTSLSQGVRVEGGGMTLTGSCSQFVEMQGSFRCTVEDLVLDGTTMPAGAAGVILDTFSLQCVARRITTNGGNNLAPIYWLIGEANEMDLCVGYSSTGNGIAYDDAANNILKNSSIYACTGAGILLTSDGGANGAGTTEGNVIESCFAYGCGAGLTVGDGAANVAVTDSFFSYNGNGITLDNTLPLGAPSRIRITSCFAGNNTNAGVVVSAGTKGSILSNIDVTGNGTTGIACADDATLSNIVSSGGCPNGTIVASAGVLKVDGVDAIVNGNAGSTVGVASSGTARVYAKNLRITLNSAGFVPAVSSSNTSRMSAKGVHITYTTVGEGFLALGSSTIALDDVTVDGANVAGSIGVNAASGCTVRVGKNVHMDAAAGPTFNFNGGSHWNRSAIGPGPVTLTGTADVVIAWPDLQSSDDVLVELVTPTGTVGPVKVTKTPGTGFRLTGTNVADTSAVNYVVL